MSEKKLDEMLPIKELAVLYTRAKDGKDPYLLQVAEAAVQSMMEAEAAMVSMAVAENVVIHALEFARTKPC